MQTESLCHFSYAEISCDEEDRNLIQNTMQPCLNSAEKATFTHPPSQNEVVIQQLHTMT